MPSAVGFRCTTPPLTAQNTDPTPVVVLYPWHPFYGKPVEILRSRRKGRFFAHSCRPIGSTQVPQEVPIWMFDERQCKQCTAGDRPSVDAAALADLAAIFTGHAGSLGGMTTTPSLATPEQPGGHDAEASAIPTKPGTARSVHHDARASAMEPAPRSGSSGDRCAPGGNAARQSTRGALAPKRRGGRS